MEDIKEETITEAEETIVSAEEAAEQEEEPRRSITGSEAKGRRISGELLYENECKITQEIYLEFSKAFLGQYSKIYYILGALCLIFGVVNFLGGAASSAFMFWVMGIVCLALPTFMYRSSRKKKYDRQVQNNGGKPLERRVLFYSDALEVFSNNGAHSVFGYEDITKVITAKNIYVLVIQKRISLLVMKNGFKKGTLEEWKAFLGSKGNWKIK